ncbi:MAG: ABC transporter ATP-binding protein [Gammaproteobacteria bacterium]|nr:ABC transporter ATP-binding protein [Gammaproteobacteria bacterium]
MKSSQFILHHLKPFRWHIVGLLLICLIWSLDLCFRPYLIKLMLDRMSAAPAADAAHILVPLAIWYVAASMGVMLIFRVWNFIMRDLIPKLKANITRELTNRLLTQSYQFYQNQFAGTLANKVNDVALGVAQIVTIMVDSFVGNAMMLVAASTALIFINPLIATIFFVWVVLFLSGSWMLAKKAHVLSDQTSEFRSQMTGTIVDILGNMNVVRLFTNQKLESQLIHDKTQNIVKSERAFEWLLIKLFSFQSVSFAIMQSVTLGALIYLRGRGLITIGDFSFSLTINIYIVDNLWQIGQRFNEFSEQIGKVTQGLRLTTDTPNLLDVNQAALMQVKQGEIVFENATFQYRENTPLFNRLNVQIQAGEKVGLVGYSGSGKTTFAHLILRLFDLQSGRILIDGQDIAQVDQNSLRQSVSFIPQDPTLFHRSILENIRYAKPEATEAEVILAAQAAHADEFIMTLPEGYQALVGERGVKLSGGQRQRIAIARAMLKNAPILILDEATSALDSVTEHLIQESLDRLMEGKTTIQWMKGTVNYTWLIVSIFEKILHVVFRR